MVIEESKYVVMEMVKQFCITITCDLYCVIYLTSSTLEANNYSSITNSLVTSLLFTA